MDPSCSAQSAQFAMVDLKSSSSQQIPPGMAYLGNIDQLLVKQQVEPLEVFADWEVTNKYRILNSAGQQCFYAAEQSDTCLRQLCTSSRPFTMNILDNLGNEIIYLDRPLRWCLSDMTVYSPREVLIGTIQENCTCSPNFDIFGPDRELIFNITGPFCYCDCCSDVNFDIRRPGQEQPIGRISKQWSGLAQELFTKADNFGIQFPLDLEIQHKALLLAATFMIDFQYFEEDAD